MKRLGISLLVLVLVGGFALPHTDAKRKRTKKRKKPSPRNTKTNKKVKVSAKKGTRQAKKSAEQRDKKANNTKVVAVGSKTQATQQPVAPKRKLTDAEKIVEKMILASGGRKAQAAIQNLKASGKIQLITAQGQQEGKFATFHLKPNFQRIEMQLGPQKIVQVFSPKGGWLMQNGFAFPLPKSMKEMFDDESARRDIELRYHQDKIKVQLVGERAIRGKNCYIILFTDSKTRRTTYYISKKEHWLIKRSYVGQGPLGQGNVRFSAYHDQYKWVSLAPPKSNKQIRKHKHSKKTTANKHSKAPKARKKQTPKDSLSQNPTTPTQDKPLEANKKDDGTRVLVPYTVENYINSKKVGTLLFKSVLINSKKLTKRLFRPRSPVD